MNGTPIKSLPAYPAVPTPPHVLAMADEYEAARCDGLPWPCYLESQMVLAIRTHGVIARGDWVYHANGAGELVRLRSSRGPRRKALPPLRVYTDGPKAAKTSNEFKDEAGHGLRVVKGDANRRWVPR